MKAFHRMVRLRASILLVLPLVVRCLATIEPLALSDVRLLDTSFQIRYERLNQKYLLDMLDPDRLLWSFRKTAGLKTSGTPFYASWEDPGCELRGHFVGHYLSALSLAWAGTGNAAFRTRLDLMVSELGKVQEAMGLGGYLSAFPAEFFDRVEALKPVWAPYYTIHKVIAGLVDAHELGGNPQALPMASRMVAYHWNRTQAVIAAKGRDHWKGVLNCEFGGMNEILYRLYRITRDPTHLEFARLFDKPLFRGPMEQGNDVLPGLHANTHLAQVAGFAEAYDTVGDEAARKATRNFFDIVTAHHSFATGGSNDHEFWQAPDEMADSVWKQKHAVETQETCTQYNILKIARSLFRWTGDVAYADFYERALVNGILGTARLPPEDWPERALPHRHGGHAHHHHHHHVNHLRRNLVSESASSDPRVNGGAQVHVGNGGANAAAAAAAAGGAVMLVDPHRRQHNEEWLNWWAFVKPRPEWNASDAHGPGVFLYLTPLGTGQSKSDNVHHWGFPFHSFWCCYGTVIESYAKLADSIYFKDMSPLQGPGADPSAPKLPPRLYVNQLVSSRATWREMELRVTMEADMFAPGTAATAHLSFEPLSAAATGAQVVRTFTLMLRVPEWAARDGERGGEGASFDVNGQAWTSCPGRPQPGSYCEITRQWSTGDVVSMRLPMRWWWKALPENRPQFAGLQAIMMGPFVMAGITHDERRLRLPSTAAPGMGQSRTRSPADISRRVYPPEEADELLSIQAGWNASLHVRHDASLLYVSAPEDGGDAMDATFRLGRSCHHGGNHPHRGGHTAAGAFSAAAGHHRLLSQLHGVEARPEGDGSGAGGGVAGSQQHSHGSLVEAFGSLQSLMRLGQHDAGQQLSLESMSYPNHYIAYDHMDVIALQPGAAAGSDPAAACSRAMWMMRAGLDGAPDTVSFEAVARPGFYLTAASAGGGGAPDAGTCRDMPGETCREGGEHGAESCAEGSYTSRVLCRQTCGWCNATASALRLQQRSAGGPAFNTASSFRLAPPARRAYPAGSYVLAASNRHYLLAPLSNLVDERYTAYFHLELS